VLVKRYGVAAARTPWAPGARNRGRLEAPLQSEPQTVRAGHRELVSLPVLGVDRDAEAGLELGLIARVAQSARHARPADVELPAILQDRRVAHEHRLACCWRTRYRARVKLTPVKGGNWTTADLARCQRTATGNVPT